MSKMRARYGFRVFAWLLVSIVSLVSASLCCAQVSPHELLDPKLRGLEKHYFPELKTIHNEIAHTSFPFPFSLNRAVGLDPKQQIEADTRSIEFARFKDRITLKVTGNYNGA